MLSDYLRVLYLHGFASSPSSRKAQFFREKLASSGVALEIPELCEGSFEHLTITDQLNVIDRIVREPASNGRQIVLIGSSLGGYLAALYAAQHAAVSRLLLLAPAFQFCRLWEEDLGETRLADWRKAGTLPIFHYGKGQTVPLGYQLMEDASRYEAYPDFRQPALLFHGTRDTVVPLQQSEAFARAHDNVRLVRVESGHELTEALEQIWPESKSFLLSAPPI